MTIKEIFDTMDYGPAPESAAEAQAWLEGHGRSFGHFIDGKMSKAKADFESRNPATGDLLANLTQGTSADVTRAIKAARTAQPGWAALGGHGRARVLYALARGLQKHSRIFAVLESLDNGKPIRESRDIDIPLVQRHFYYHAGMAQLMESELPDRAPLGVCGQIIPWNFPLLMLAWKVAPALAMGNTVVLKPAEYTSLTALRFAELCVEAGVPPGVINIVTGDGATGAALVDAPVNKIAFTGSTDVGRRIREATAGRNIPLTLELGGKSPYIVFDDADIDSAVEGLVDAIWFNQGQVCCAGSRLLLQEGIAERFTQKLKRRMDGLRLGDPLDKAIDVGAIVDPIQLKAITAKVDACKSGEIYQAATPLPKAGCYYPPTLITGLGPADPLMQEEIFGPVLVATTFRTPQEAVDLANNTRYGLAATIWSENINLALHIAPQLAAGVVWLNATNLFDAAAGFGGVRESGYGREGGWEGLKAYTKPTAKAQPITPLPAFKGDGSGEGLDRTHKLYIGGKQARPDGGYSRPVFGAKGQYLGAASLANRKDVRNAVEAAAKARGWGKTTGHLRAQILYYLGENLATRAEGIAKSLNAQTDRRDGAKEVDTAVSRLFTYAAWADKYDHSAKPVPMRGTVLAINEPVGLAAAICPDERPLLGLVSLMAPCLAMGVPVVLHASEAFPLAASDLVQVLETSDVPAGTVNILTGDRKDTAPHLAAHMEIDTIWNFADPGLAADIERVAAGNLKRTWCPTSTPDWMSPGAEGRAFLDAATEVKTVWIPYGE